MKSLAIVLSLSVASASARADEETIRVRAGGNCPTSLALRLELESLLAPRDLMRGALPIAEVFDSGSSYGVNFGGHTRMFTDEAHRCDERARQLALFIALALPETRPMDERTRRHINGRRMRKAGEGILIVGLAHLAVGVGMAAAHIEPLYIFPLAIGGVVTGVGAPLFFTGLSVERRSAAPQLSLSTLEGHGALLSLRFSL